MTLPAEFIEKYQKLLGEESNNFFEAIDKQSKKGFRLNPLKYNYQDVQYSLKEPIEFTSDGYYGGVSGRDSEWTGGYVYSQDPSAMYPAVALDVKPGDIVLDLCAAPGGKSTALASALRNEGVLVANEISRSRAKDLRENLERWGATNVVVTNESPDRLAKKLPAFFDKILIDAPCSGEGMFRKDPDAMQYWSQEYVITCQTRQKEILAEAMKMLKPGGEIVYSTCTYSPEEDEEIVAWLVENYNLKVEPLKLFKGMSSGRPDWTGANLPDLKETVRLWFQNGVGEGQFVARLRNTEENSNNESKTEKRKKKRQKKTTVTRLNKEEIATVEKVITNFVLPTGLENWQKEVLQSNGHVFVPALDPEILNDLHILNNGVELGLLKKKRFEPSHQLAEVLGQKEQRQLINFEDKANYERYLHGETIKVDSKLRGFVLVAYRNHIFSFGKIGNDQILKNFYPKGLRK
ncbi:RsmB/NOP family class I SAM-dependent RNA methyltransferase [Lactobacillus taiwanensis]|uniref:RNA methyltransferase n=1 Tax=Lactobacillus taiwanensis TaxID=508451 RepID=A0A256LEN2_9LACO|nr:RsmF rRNA methyltransferase first C-terminal domain-containing protein [Lactobacillus taiwanensis]OYR87419.1 RNA methyltransferase [Lactobacillus taiwanensis]OYR91037.1 RNA methyltransferase [Lactobacillus taiwanensis]OYR91318.1 RNA methyltransferase [Lactobacillus taiwanensis]OYR94445.1 RNA methyltransferase [Lactobacillus taiwanensis]OYR94811.1 RNA methyltransferase [Lactobacillus taiwanensis]